MKTETFDHQLPFRDQTNVSNHQKHAQHQHNTSKTNTKGFQGQNKVKTSTLNIFETSRTNTQKPQKQALQPHKTTLKKQNTESKVMRKKVNSCLRNQNFKFEGLTQFDNGKSRNNVKLQKIEIGQRKKENTSADIKGNPSKSFMIRKKNVSNYCKKSQTKKQTTMPPWNILHHQPSPFFLDIELDNNKSNLLLPQKPLKPIREQNIQSMPSVSVEQCLLKQANPSIMLNPIAQKKQPQLNSTIGIKVKPVMCKDTKKNNKQFQDDKKCKEEKSKQKKRIDTQNSAKYLQIMIKKIRRISKLQSQNDKNNIKKVIEIEGQAILQNPSKESRQKDISSEQSKRKIGIPHICKTIKIPWSSILDYANQEQSNKLKGQLQLMKGKQTSLHAIPDSFGPISVISYSLMRGHEAGIQSLRQLYEQLNFEQRLENEAISKMLLQ